MQVANKKNGGRKLFIAANNRCGECSGYSHSCIREKACQALGKLPTSKTCESFKPNVHDFVKGKKSNDLETLGKLISTLTTKDRNILASILVREQITKKHGFSFGQKVYLQWSGSSGSTYLNNFTSAIVLDCDKTYVRLMADSGALLSLLREGLHLYTVAEFKKIKADMYNAKKFVDPKSVVSHVGVVPLDNLIESGHAEKSKRLKRQGAKVVKKKSDDLTSFANRMSRGHVVATSSSKATELIFD